jgi:hypothetical protein
MVWFNDNIPANDVDNGLTFGPLLQLSTYGTIGEAADGEEG